MSINPEIHDHRDFPRPGRNLRHEHQGGNSPHTHDRQPGEALRPYLTRKQHAADVARLRDKATSLRRLHLDHNALDAELAADLLELHDNTGISLDHWQSARAFVENQIHHPIVENKV